MKNLYLYVYNSNLSDIIKVESLKNIILEELFELFNTDLLMAIHISPKDKVVLNYNQLLFATKQKLTFKEAGIEINKDTIIIDCSCKINNFEQVMQLKQLIKNQLITLL